MNAYAYIDGGFLRTIAEVAGQSPYDPQILAGKVAMDASPFGTAWVHVSRTLYFDANPDDDEQSIDKLSPYWDAVDALDDTHLYFGSLRGKPNKKSRRQKKVDTLLTVEMLSGAYAGRFQVAILITADSDFVPLVNEVRRAGPHVVVAAGTDVPTVAGASPKYSYHSDLRRAADRFVELPPAIDTHFGHWFKPLAVGS